MIGRTVIVTGANTGIGFETAAGLAEMGGRVVITARDPKKGERAIAEIKRRHPEADVHLMLLDLARLSDVRAFAEAFNERFDRLNVLINNAGLILDRRTLTEDGFETTFQVRLLRWPPLLTSALQPRFG